MRRASSFLLLSLYLPIISAATQVAPVAAAPVAPAQPAVPTPSAMKDPLGCKLIKASAYAYGLNQTGAFDPKTDLGLLIGEPGEGYGFVSPSTDKSDGDRDAGLVWHSASELIVAFRGTLPDVANSQDTSRQVLSLEDWVNNANYSPKVDPKLGQVHAGFEAAFEQVWPGLMQQIVAWQKAGKLGPNVKVYVTGHSKGGSLAMLAALTLRADKLTPVTEVVTFGAPRVGGPDFAAKYAAAAIAGIRYENAQDLVPHVPLNSLELSLAPLLRRVIDLKGQPSGDYVSVGKLYYIDADVGVVSPADAEAEDDLEKSRLLEFAPMIFQAPKDIAETVVGAHSIAPDSAYYNAVCGVRSVASMAMPVAWPSGRTGRHG